MKKRISQEDFYAWREYSKGIKKLPNDKVSEPVVPSNLLERYHVAPSLKKPSTPIAYDEKSKKPISTDIFTDKHLDKKKLRNLKKGRIHPEAVLDLHGLKRFEAQAKLKSFIEISIQKKLRLILIITGKGNRSYNSDSAGVLRKNFPHWISSLPDANKILSVVQASPLHGGSGAFYVYMRKSLQN